VDVKVDRKREVIQVGMNPEISEETNVESQGVKRMRADVKAQWVAALRSGEYQQGRGLLHYHDGNADRMCCLGVLSHLAYEAEVCDREADEDGEFTYSGSNNYLPYPVVDWAGLDTHNPGVLEEPKNLANLNDAGFTFDQIADLIEWGL
jgi:hypothetical protein